MMSDLSEDLRQIYLKTLYRSTPALLIQECLAREEVKRSLEEPVSLVALGKSASGLMKGAAASIQIAEAFAVLPERYRQDAFPPFTEVVYGTHPEISDASFEAGEKLISFVEKLKYSALVLVSGGSSACLAKPLEPWFTREDLVKANRLLIRSGLPIERMNIVRKHLSAIKGGRLGEMLPSGTVTLVLSDVSRGCWPVVGSGPTFPDESTNHEAAEILADLGDAWAMELAMRLKDRDVPDTPGTLRDRHHFLLGDNGTLVENATVQIEMMGYEPVAIPQELDADVGEITERLWSEFQNLEKGQILAGGGEPTVEVTGQGRGGRCSEIAVRLGKRARDEGRRDLLALVASSDGVDGDTDASGYLLEPSRYFDRAIDDRIYDRALENSNSWSIVDSFAIPMEARPTGNNLRDIFFVARG